jgi:mono/diheme cytochrome c family protein
MTPRLSGLAAVCAVGASVACGASSASSPAVPDFQRYLDDASFRRSELLASLVNPSDGYAELRIAHYATGDGNDWDLLPEWNPAADTVGASELDAPGGASATVLSSAAAPLVLPQTVASLDDPALLALGKAAFSSYPAQLAPYFQQAIASRAQAARYGLWIDASKGVGGLVRARMADGSGALALTCATCHSSPGPDGSIAVGLANASLDIGAAILDAEGAPDGPTSTDPIAAWGPGRLDVTTTAGTEPVRISDLRPVRFLTYLQQDATVRARDIVALAIRIETLIVTSNDDALRPPRVIALALAAYITSLATALPSLDAATAAFPDGAGIFASQCASCHVPPALTGEPVPLSVVGTDPTLGLSANRGTGTYRVPSLRGVASRGPLLHDATLPSVGAMFDPARLTSSFTEKLHGTGAVQGHPFGLALSDVDRQALLAFLGGL